MKTQIVLALILASAACGEGVVSNPYQYWSLNDCRGGINQEPENKAKNQVIDARNVWCPEGQLVDRPGFQYAAQAFLSPTRSTAGTVVVENPIATFNTTNVLGALPVGSRWYVGWSSQPASTMVSIEVQMTVANTSTDTWVTAEYWNGVEWKGAVAFETRDLGGATSHLQGDRYFQVGIPADWAATTVNSLSRYWWRFTIQRTALSAATQISAAYYTTAAADGLHFFEPIVAQFSSAKRYFTGIYFAPDETPESQILQSPDLRWAFVTGTTSIRHEVKGQAGYSSQPLTHAVIPEFDVLFTAYNQSIGELSRNTIPDAQTIPSDAQVNTRPEIVGTVGGIKSPYHPDYVPQLASFPKANLIAYFQGLLWFADIKDGPSTIRWSAPAIDGAYNVFPEDSFESITADGTITAISGLNEHLVVFFQDSIWLMIYSGLNDLELPTFAATRVVSGVGCVAHGSVQKVRGKLIFLAEDGVYAFDGSPNVVKLSEAIDTQISKIRTGRRRQVSSVHWQTQNAYILSASVADEGTSSTTTTAVEEPNNFVFVYDYAREAWWFWDNIEAQFWLRDEGLADEELIYFQDRYGRLFQLHGNHDNGAAIESYFTTHRFGHFDAATKTLREVRLRGNQTVGSLDITVIAGDETGTAAAITMSADGDDKYGTAIYGTDTYTSERRVERKLKRRTQGRWFQVKVANDAKYLSLKFAGLDLGYIVEGRR